jgi:hypothetical protein
MHYGETIVFLKFVYLIECNPLWYVSIWYILFSLDKKFTMGDLQAILFIYMISQRFKISRKFVLDRPYFAGRYEHGGTRAAPTDAWLIDLRAI